MMAAVQATATLPAKRRVEQAIQAWVASYRIGTKIQCAEGLAVLDQLPAGLNGWEILAQRMAENPSETAVSQLPHGLGPIRIYMAVNNLLQAIIKLFYRGLRAAERKYSASPSLEKSKM